MAGVSTGVVVAYGILAVGVIATFAVQAWPWSIKSMILLALTASVPAILFLIFITASTPFVL